MPTGTPEPALEAKMTAIEGIGGPTAPRFVARPSPRGANGFALPADSVTAEQPSVIAGPETISLTSVLTLQELGSKTEADRKARRHGQDILAALAGLQRALLAGADDADVLQRLALLAATVPHAADRSLAAMLSAILVRARVELARRQG
jgi:hypothetical protein